MKKRRVRLIIIIAGIVLLMTGIAVGIFFWTRGSYKYSVNEDGTLTIVEYKGNEDAVIIPDTIHGRKVTIIGECAFANNHTIESVTIPDTVTIIEAGAFIRCKYLLEVRGGDNIVQIGAYAFYFCVSLRGIEFSDKLVEIGDGAFEHCCLLGPIKLPGSLRDIGKYAFYNCFLTESLEVPEGVEDIGRAAFAKDQLYPSLLEGYNSSEYLIVGQGILLNYPDNEEIIVIPEGVQQISYCYHGGEKVKEIYVAESVTRINPLIVRADKEVNIYIPSSVISIQVAPNEKREGIVKVMSKLTLVVESGSYAEEYAVQAAEKYGTKYIVVEKIEYPEL